MRETQKKIQQIFFDFEIIAFELVALNNLAFTEREYLSSGLNLLTNRLKISETSKNEFLELTFFHRVKKIWLK